MTNQEQNLMTPHHRKTQKSTDKTHQRAQNTNQQHMVLKIRIALQLRMSKSHLYCRIHVTGQYNRRYTTRKDGPNTLKNTQEAQTPTRTQRPSRTQKTAGPPKAAPKQQQHQRVARHQRTQRKGLQKR